MTNPNCVHLSLKPANKPVQLKVGKKEPISLNLKAALQGPPGPPGPPGPAGSATVTVKGLQNDVFLEWLLSLQYAAEGVPAFGAIRWHDGPATYADGQPCYKIEPYFASLAVYYALEAAPERAGEMAVRWLNWWMTHRNPTTQTALVHYANADGSALATALPAAAPAVPPDDEDATDSNLALYLLALGRYISIFGTDKLADGWREHVQAVYDYMASPAVRHTDNLTWAKPTYPIKYLMDNVEVWAGLGAAVSIFQMLGDTARRDSAQAWRTALKQAIVQTYWQDASGTWSHSMDGAGTVTHSNLATPYPDALCQLWPAVFGLDTRGGYAKVAEQWPQWATQGIGNDGSVYPQLAQAACMAGDAEQAHAWLVAVAAQRREGNSFRWPFTCADAAVCAVVARMSKVAPSSESASVSISSNFLVNYLLKRG